MNILLEFTTLTYKLKHEIAKKLAELYPSSKFVGLVSSHVDTERYLREQNDIRYELLRDTRFLPLEFLNQEMDLEELREFESTMPEKSLWRYVAMDAGWGNSFVKTAYRPKRYIYDVSNNDNIMKILLGYLRFYKKILHEYKIDVVLPAAGMMSMSWPILEQLCHNLQIPCLVPLSLRTLNYVALTPNRKYTFPQIDKTFKELSEGKLSLDVSKGEKCYQQIMEVLNNNAYYDRPRIQHFKRTIPQIRFVRNAIREVKKETSRWVKESRLRTDTRIISRQKNDLRSLLSNYSYALRSCYQILKLIDDGFYSKYDPSCKYIYLPLQNTPEYSTAVRAPMWANQLVIIEALAKSIPMGWRLYVREHPGTLTTRVRQTSFYKEIKSYPNVDLIPVSINNTEVIKNAQLVVSSGGTSGWETIQMGKPLISLTDDIFDVMELSRKCTDLESLSISIHEEINRMKSISDQERKRRMVLFLTAMLEHAVWFDNPLHVYGEAAFSEEEMDSVSAAIAGKVRDYIERSKNEVKVHV